MAEETLESLLIHWCGSEELVKTFQGKILILSVVGYIAGYVHIFRTFCIVNLRKSFIFKVTFKLFIYFTENAMDIETLQCLDDSTIRELIPQVGTRLKFKEDVPIL